MRSLPKEYIPNSGPQQGDASNYIPGYPIKRKAVISMWAALSNVFTYLTRSRKEGAGAAVLATLAQANGGQRIVVGSAGS